MGTQMKKKYENIDELIKAANAYITTNTIVAVRSFRISLGVSKHLLSTWKRSEPDYFNLIKTYEDAILAKIEEYAIYGALHPDLQALNVKTTHYRDGSSTTEPLPFKFNNIGAMFALKAYDRDRYIPEISMRETKVDESGAKLVEIVTPKRLATKGRQSVKSTKIHRKPKQV